MILPPKVSCENSTKANIGHAFSRRLVCRETRASQEALSANPTKQTYIQYKLNTGTNNSPTACPAEGTRRPYRAMGCMHFHALHVLISNAI